MLTNMIIYILSDFTICRIIVIFLTGIKRKLTFPLLGH